MLLKTKKIFLLLLTLNLFACRNKNIEFSQVETFKNNCWGVNDVIQFSHDIKDTLQFYDLHINIRNNNDYEFSNIYLFVNVYYPDNTMITDTVEGILADEKGKWLGKGTGQYKENTFVYRRKVRFKQSGKYVFVLQHAMRKEDLCGIGSCGFEIIKSK